MEGCMDEAGWPGKGRLVGKERREEFGERIQGLIKLYQLGPQMRRLVADACPPLRQKSLTLCCPLNTSVCDPGALCYVCARVCVVSESERECECVCFCPQTSPLVSDFRS